MNKKNLIFLVAAVLIIGGVFFFAKSAFKSTENEKIAALDQSLFIKDHSPTLGNKDAKVTIVEFLDPECEACRAMDPIIKGLVKEYGDKVYYVVRYMPLHGNSTLAAVTLEEAREQGKYWEALSTLFYYQPEWASHHDPKPELIRKFVEGVGVNLKDISDAKLLEKHQAKVELDKKDGVHLGVRLTPTIFVNGISVDQMGFEPLKSAIEAALK